MLCDWDEIEEEALEALEDTTMLEVFSPVRQDWMDGTDDYLRRGKAQ